jgi:haloalkane dehalogenase
MPESSGTSTPEWVNRSLFPFASRWMEMDGFKIHYVDEGSGPAIVFFHGTPEWSFAWRNLIKDLRTEYRCIAMDYPGFGLSDKPPGGDYRVAVQSRRMTAFIDRLEVDSFSIVATDFGGGIALGLAVDAPERINKIVLFNTWMRDLRKDSHYARPARVMNTWFGKFLYKQMNFPVTAILPAAFGDRQSLTRDVQEHYKKALPSPADRQGTYTFARELMNAGPWWDEQAGKLGTLKNRPVLLFWGIKDKFVPPRELEFWISRFPGARVVRFPEAGHFVQEEKAAEMILALREFLAEDSAPTANR